MKKLALCIFILFSCSMLTFCQTAKILSSYKTDKNLDLKLKQIVASLNLNKDFNVGEDGLEQISLAVIDLSKKDPVIAGVNYDNFIYPASVYKMYVAAEILEQISKKEHSLYEKYVVKFPNAVDKSREISNDPRPLLKEGDTVTINYLLDLMITRSDNSAANCLIDIAKRENINNLMHANNWYGSEVTRKYLSRTYEDSLYKKVKGTETCALHAADFMYKIYKGKLVNSWVSSQMKSFLSRQLDDTKLAQGLPANTMFSHKTGWFSYWTNDVGIVENDEAKYIISCFLPLTEDEALPLMKTISEEIYKIMINKKELKK